MQTPDAKTLYKLRSRTVALNYADRTEHRGIRRFHCRGLRRVSAEIGAVVLAHNLLASDASRDPTLGDRSTADDDTSQTACGA